MSGRCGTKSKQGSRSSDAPRPEGGKLPAGKVMRITGEETENLSDADDGKDPASKALGKKDGAARAAEMPALAAGAKISLSVDTQILCDHEGNSE